MKPNKTIVKIWSLGEAEKEFSKLHEQNFVVVSVTACGDSNNKLCFVLVQLPTSTIMGIGGQA